MTTVNQKMDALTAQVAELTEQVRNLAASQLCANQFIELGRIEEREERDKLTGRSATRRPAAPRARHLSAIR